MYFPKGWKDLNSRLNESVLRKSHWSLKTHQEVRLFRVESKCTTNTQLLMFMRLGVPVDAGKALAQVKGTASFLPTSI